MLDRCVTPPPRCPSSASWLPWCRGGRIRAGRTRQLAVGAAPGAAAGTACRYRTHVQARTPMPVLLPPARLIFLRELSEETPAGPSGGPPKVQRDQQAGGCMGVAGQADRKASPSQELSGLAGPAGQPAPSEEPQPAEASAAEAADPAGLGGLGRSAVKPEGQWDAVWLEPQQLMDEGLLLSSRWRRHHSGPCILAALSSALRACSS